MTGCFEGEVAVISGSGKGLGKSYAKFLALEGAKVMICGTSDHCKEVSEQINCSGGISDYFVGDISNEICCQEIIDKAVSLWGRIDILINNAGNRPDEKIKISDMKNADLDRVIKVHVNGTFNLSVCAWKHMIKQNYGRILNTTSSVILGYEEMQDYILPHAIAKSSIIGLTKTLALAGKEHGIKINAIMPSSMGIGWGVDIEELNKILNPIYKIESTDSTLDRVACSAAFLVHESTPCTGQIFSACNGRMSLIFLGETKGYRCQNVTIDKLQAHFEEIIDQSGYYVPDGRKHIELEAGIK